jgi:Nucleotidyl transferase AbiEii toxin, Type IV TA system
VTKRKPTDIPASVRGRLQQQAKDAGRPFGELLQYYAMERLLYRLSKSAHANKFVLKGALMLVAWRASTFRPTRDIDLLARMPNDVESVAQVFKDVCQQAVEDDGLVFDADSVQGKVIKEDADYEGVRVTFLGKLQRSRLPMQVDIGFGDVVFPEPTLSDYPTLLDFKPPKLYSYPRETTIAEKFEAMVQLGELNSRMKDFFDIWLLSHQFDFDGAVLSEAVRRTFANRDTAIAANPVAWTSEFASDPANQTQWAGFVRKSRFATAPATLLEVVEGVRDFLKPLSAAAESGQPFIMHWKSPGPWNRMA